MRAGLSEKWRDICGGHSVLGLSARVFLYYGRFEILLFSESEIGAECSVVFGSQEILLLSASILILLCCVWVPARPVFTVHDNITRNELAVG